jgi:hippurate hydrolase
MTSAAGNIGPSRLGPLSTLVADEALSSIVTLRRDIHCHPELSFQETRTSSLIAEKLEQWGYDVATGVAGTGVVGSLTIGDGPRKLGLRADIDALPISETTDLPFASQAKGVMHACGHDGHTAILLAAARRLAEERCFNGTLRVIFQPAEEIGAGARRMLEEGLLERFPIDAIFGLHNWPGEPSGRFGVLDGPAMAAVDRISATIQGRGGHGAEPHTTVDPVLAAAHVVTALQSVVSRNVDPRHAAVVTVGAIHGGNASNVIPDSVDLKLTIRSYDPAVRDLLENRLKNLIASVSEGFGATANVAYERGFPSVVNPAREAAIVRDVVARTFGQDALIPGFRPRMASEDFAFFLERLPGAFIFVGNGDGAPLHRPDYQFNDAIIGPASTLWVALARQFLNGDAA